jgi:hypothetical protein
MSESLVIGGQLGSYLIESVIGRGGMSTVYRAVHTRLGTPVALKVLSPELSEDDAFRERFLREAKMAAGIDHPNVIPIYDTGLSGESLYIVMRYVAGGDLKTLLMTTGPLSPERAVSILDPVARALDVAHAHKLVHRDVKPANILLQKGSDGEVEHVYLSDFGVMKHASSISGLTKTGAMVGTIDYMAPEQIEGGDVSAKTDVYALGCLFYHCITGRVPHHRESEAAVLWAHMKGDFEPASSVRDGIPAAIDGPIARALSKDPAARYDKCEDFMRACAAALSNAGQTAADAIGPSSALAGATVAESAMSPASDETAWPGLESSPAPTSPDRPGVPVGAGAPAAAPPPAEPARAATGAGSNGSGRGSRRLLAGRAWIAGVVVLVVGGIVAAVALSGGDDSASSAKKTAPGQPFDATLSGVPTNRVPGNGTATVRLNGREANVTVNTNKLLDPAVHPMHIHAGGQGKCPPASAARDHGGHQAISTVDGEGFYGPPVTALTTTGDTSKQSILVFSRFPHTGKIRYTRTFQVPAKTARLIRRGQASVIVHGIDYNDNGVYDGVLDRSDLDAQLNGETTAPALCGPLTTSPDSGTHAGGGTVYTAALQALKPAAPNSGWIEVP